MASFRFACCDVFTDQVPGFGVAINGPGWSRVHRVLDTIGGLPSLTGSPLAKRQYAPRGRCNFHRP